MIRPLQPSDIPTLRSWYETSGFAYDFPDLRGERMESVMVFTDENDVPLAAVAAERIIQLYLWMEEGLHPAAKLRIIREMHGSLSNALRGKGYNSAEAFLPPEIEHSFGRRLMRSFGWSRNWHSVTRAF